MLKCNGTTFERLIEQYLSKLKIHILSDPEIPLIGIFSLGKTYTREQGFISLFTIATTSEQPSSP